MKMMTDYQRELVESHLHLIDQVIRHRIRVKGTVMQTYEDFYSVGCEAICSAAMRYRTEAGEFAPFAATVIYNAMIDYCRNLNYRAAFDSDLPTDRDDEAISLRALSTTDGDIEAALDSKALVSAVADCKARYSGVARKGIEVLELKSLGYTSRELAERYGTTVNNINAWISRARSKLLSDPAFLAAFL